MNNFRSQHEAILHLCGECEYKSTTKSSNKKHTETKHESVHYKCEKCDYKANGIQSLNKHIKSIHVSEEEVIFLCHYYGRCQKYPSPHKLNLVLYQYKIRFDTRSRSRLINSSRSRSCTWLKHILR